MRNAGLVGVAAAVVLASFALGSALAQDATTAPSAALGTRSRQLCRSFPDVAERSPENAVLAEVDTRDGAIPLGRWVLDREDRGWQIAAVERQVVVKATGALEGWTHVCLVPIAR